MQSSSLVGLFSGFIEGLSKTKACRLFPEEIWSCENKRYHFKCAHSRFTQGPYVMTHTLYLVADAATGHTIYVEYGESSSGNNLYGKNPKVVIIGVEDLLHHIINTLSVCWCSITGNPEYSREIRKLAKVLADKANPHSSCEICGVGLTRNHFANTQNTLGNNICYSCSQLMLSLEEQQGKVFERQIVLYPEVIELVRKHLK